MASASLHRYRWTALAAQWMTGFVPDLTGIVYSYIVPMAGWMEEVRRDREHAEQWNAMIRKDKSRQSGGAGEVGNNFNHNEEKGDASS
ncbi:MAG: hypothetical protein ACTS5I_06820 [Rhodanobacter sp.]